MILVSLRDYGSDVLADPRTKTPVLSPHLPTVAVARKLEYDVASLWGDENMFFWPLRSWA